MPILPISYPSPIQLHLASEASILPREDCFLRKPKQKTLDSLCYAKMVFRPLGNKTCSGKKKLHFLMYTTLEPCEICTYFTSNNGIISPLITITCIILHVGTTDALVGLRHTIADLLFFFFNFYCYSITVVCLFSLSLHPTPAEPTSLPHLHPHL